MVVDSIQRVTGRYDPAPLLLTDWVYLPEGEFIVTFEDGRRERIHGRAEVNMTTGEVRKLKERPMTDWPREIPNDLRDRLKDVMGYRSYGAAEIWDTVREWLIEQGATPPQS